MNICSQEKSRSSDYFFFSEAPPPPGWNRADAGGAISISMRKLQKEGGGSTIAKHRECHCTTNDINGVESVCKKSQSFDSQTHTYFVLTHNSSGGFSTTTHTLSREKSSFSLFLSLVVLGVHERVQKWCTFCILSTFSSMIHPLSLGTHTSDFPWISRNL